MRAYWLYPPLGGVLAATLLLAACTEQRPLATAPATNPLVRAAAVAARPAHLMRNGVRYRDSGHALAIARSGTAQLALRAMLDSAGVTTVEVTTGRFDTTAAFSGAITQLQLKVFDRNGALVLTRKLEGSNTGFVSVPLYGLGLGFLVQVQATVRPPDGMRTELVTVRDTVVFRPDLMVLNLELPLGGRPGVPLPVSATIHERQGSLGARATCVLYVDGAVVDRAANIWVDAGGLVTCAFQHVFPTLRRYQVAVRVQDVAPGDYNLWNNARYGTLELRNLFEYNANVTSTFSESWGRSTGDAFRADGAAGYHYFYESGDSTRYQSAYLSGLMRRAVSFPLARVHVAQRNGSLILDDTTFPLPITYQFVDADSSYTCGSRYGDGSWFSLCTFASVGQPPQTWLSYGRDAGDVIYYSSSLMISWYPGGYDYSYSWNRSGSAWGGSIAPIMGGTYEFVVGVEEGSMVWSLTPRVQLQWFDYGNQSGPSCSSYDDDGVPPTHYSWCQESSYRQTGYSGQVNGMPDTTALIP